MAFKPDQNMITAIPQIDRVQFERVMAVMRRLPENIGRNALSAAMRTSVRTVENRSKGLLGEYGRIRTGRLRDLVKGKVKNTRRYGSSFHKGTVGVPAGRSKADRNGAYYAPFVEFGHKVITKNFKDTGATVAAAPFLSEGLHKTQRVIIYEFTGNIKHELEKRIARLPKAKKAAYTVKYGV